MFQCPMCEGPVDQHDGCYVCRNCGQLTVLDPKPTLNEQIYNLATDIWYKTVNGCGHPGVPGAAGNDTALYDGEQAFLLGARQTLEEVLNFVEMNHVEVCRPDNANGPKGCQ